MHALVVAVCFVACLIPVAQFCGFIVGEFEVGAIVRVRVTSRTVALGGVRIALGTVISLNPLDSRQKNALEHLLV